MLAQPLTGSPTGAAVFEKVLNRLTVIAERFLGRTTRALSRMIRQYFTLRLFRTGNPPHHLPLQLTEVTFAALCCNSCTLRAIMDATRMSPVICCTRGMVPRTEIAAGRVAATLFVQSCSSVMHLNHSSNAGLRQPQTIGPQRLFSSSVLRPSLLLSHAMALASEKKLLVPTCSYL